MRVLIFAALVLLALVFVGWLQFGTAEGDPAVRVNTDKVREDTANLVEKAGDAADEVNRRIDTDSEF